MQAEIENPNEVTGYFGGVFVTIVNKQLIRIINEKNTPINEFKPTCDILASYMIREGFITTPRPRVEIIPNDKSF
jgi:hypothetical protein